MGRMILAVIAGYVLIGVLVTITDRVFGAVHPGSMSMGMAPRYYFALTLVTDFVYSVVGGYVCSWIARERAWEGTICLIALGETMGLASQIMFWRRVPHWFGIGLLVLYPVAVWIGSKLRPEVRTAVV